MRDVMGVCCAKCRAVMWGVSLPQIMRCTTCGNEDRNEFINVSILDFGEDNVGYTCN